MVNGREWKRHEEEFFILAGRADSLNLQVASEQTLGKQYEIGHTYFCDVVDFAAQWLERQDNPHTILFDRAILLRMISREHSVL